MLSRFSDNIRVMDFVDCILDQRAMDESVKSGSASSVEVLGNASTAFGIIVALGGREETFQTM
jgi:hypothetical protein